MFGLEPMKKASQIILPKKNVYYIGLISNLYDKSFSYMKLF